MKRKLLLGGGAALGSLVALASPAMAQPEPTFDRFSEGADVAQTVVLDNIFIVVAAVLVFLMQPGFALVEAGLTQAKSVANIMMKNLMDAALGVLVFFIVGWGIAYPGDFSIGSLFGFAGFGVPGLADLPDLAAAGTDDFYPLAVSVDFFFQAAFAAAAATIVSGAMAGRTQFRGYLVYTVLITGLIYPIVVGWKWGGGWLDELGYIDFAGSGVVHMVGGVAALMGAIVVGPRLGKFGADGKPRAIPGHAIPLAITGVFLLFIGWFGFNPGSQLQADMEVPRIAVMTLLAACAGGTTAMITSWIWMKKPDVSMAGNGVLAGLVAICAGIGDFDEWGTLATGAIAGIIVVAAVLIVERLRVDDPVGAFSVHGVCGFWGVISVGLFASSTAGVGGSSASGVDGLFYGGGLGVLGDQLIGAIAIGVFVAIAAGVLFGALKAAGWLRVSKEDELEGLDVSEHGAPGYGPDPTATESFDGGLPAPVASHA